MNALIEAVNGLFNGAVLSGGELAETASFALESVDWAGEFKSPDAVRNPTADKYLEEACACSGQNGSCSRRIADALLLFADQLEWRTRPVGNETAPDMAVFARNYTSTRIIGDGALLQSDKVTAGFTLQGVDTYYPPHAHTAEESYWIIGGEGDWRIGCKPWFAVAPGDSVYHGSRAVHAMQTNERPMLTVWLWTSHLESEVMIVRG